MRLRQKLILYFMPVPLAVLIFIGVFVNANAHQRMEKEIFTRLNTMSLLMRDKVQYFIEDRIGIAQVIAAAVNKQAFALLAAGRDGTDQAAFARDTLTRQLERIRQAMNVSDIMLVNAQGRTILHLNEFHERSGSHHAPFSQVALAAARSGVYLGDIVPIDEKEQPYVLSLLTRVDDTGGGLLGYVNLEVNMNPLYRILQDNAGLGESGESFLVRNNPNGDLVFLSPVRHGPGGVLSPFTRMGSTIAVPAQNAVSGKFGMGFSVDYRGRQVLASWNYIPRAGWGLVVKLDEEEALRSTRQFSYLMITLIAVASLVLMVLTARIAHSIAAPIRKLTESAKIVADGNWDHRAALTSKDEIGDLGRAFDDMSARLKATTASRDELSREIDGRKKAQAQLDQSKRELEMLLYVTSHDLKEPLRAIEYFSQAVADQYADRLDEKGKDYLKRAKDAAARMTQLLDDILMLSRARKMALAEKPIPAASFVKEALTRLNAKIALSGASMRVADDLPHLRADSFWATQAVYNLIANALKFRREGALPEIDIVGYNGEHGRGISVCDRGIGVPAEYLESIFGLFKRAVGREIEGTGAGLAIVREVATRHGGKAWGERREGGGSIFTVTLDKL